MKRAVYLFSCITLLLASSQLFAQAPKLPRPKNVPAGFLQLDQERSQLVMQAADIEGRSDEHDRKCKNVVRGTDLARECATEQQQLFKEMDDYIAACRALNLKISETTRRKPVELPVVDPGFFVSEPERQFIQAQITALSERKKSFQDQLTAIEKIRDGQTLYAKDMDQLRQQLILDNAVHAFNVMEAGLSALAENGHLATDQEAAIRPLIAAAKGGIQAVSSASADSNPTRRVEKAVDAAFTLKNLANVSEKIMTSEQWKGFKRAIDTLPKLLRISERMINSRPGEDTTKLFCQNLDDVLDAAGQFFYPLKTARSTAHILDGEVAMRMIGHDRGAVEDAFVKTSTAKRYYLNRISEVEELLRFYEDEERRISTK